MGMTLVTGASGFVGSHLMKEMAQRGLPVRGVTRGTVPGLVTVPSYGPETDWSACLEGIDTVVHLAARVHVMRETASDPLSLFRRPMSLPRSIWHAKPRMPASAGSSSSVPSR